MHKANEKTMQPFEFDLEKDIHKNPEKGKEILNATAECIEDVKTELRKDADLEDYDDFGVLLHGFSALTKVITKIARKQ